LGVISFNWDLICERALENAGVPWGYSSRTAPLAVIKPHGSLNWTKHLQQVDSGRRITNPIDFAPIAPQSTLSFMPSRPFEDPLLGLDSDDLRCITFPGDLEYFDSKQRPRAATDQNLLWTETQELIAKATTIVFIGYSLPQYDALARDRLQEACQGKLIEVYNPSCEALSEFRSVFGDAGIKFIRVKFEESSFAERLGHPAIQSS